MNDSLGVGSFIYIGLTVCDLSNVEYGVIEKLYSLDLVLGLNLLNVSLGAGESIICGGLCHIYELFTYSEYLVDFFITFASVRDYNLFSNLFAVADLLVTDLFLRDYALTYVSEGSVDLVMAVVLALCCRTGLCEGVL